METSTKAGTADGSLDNVAPTYSPTNSFAPTSLDTLPLYESLEAQALSASVQPRVTVVEGLPAHRGIASISNSGTGTVWCNGAPTFWVTGHQGDNESPFCLEDGRWVLTNTTQLDSWDVLNLDKIDRHYCVTMDVNRDGRDDILCNVGASKGKKEGFNELYITQFDGSLQKIQSGHGLQKYPTMRNRLAVTLKDWSGTENLVFFATKGKPRSDGKPNVPRMFQNVYTNESTLPYFTEVNGPWTKYHFEATCTVAGDFSSDNHDDLIVCREDGKALLFTQGPFRTFSEVVVAWSQKAQASYWVNARLADVNNDGVQDLAVVTKGRRKSLPSSLKVFLGIQATPYFDFRKPYFVANLTWSAPDLEVLDVNNDGIKDIYVVQVDTRKGKYCGPGDGTGPDPPPDFVPPIDNANDVLFIGTSDPTKAFIPAVLKSSQPGCGAFVQKWDYRTMLLSGESFANAGYAMLLEW